MLTYTTCFMKNTSNTQNKVERRMALFHNYANHFALVLNMLHYIALLEVYKEKPSSEGV